MRTLLQDLKHSARQLIRRPWFTLTAVLTLAIGMGVNAVAFSVVNGVLFKGFARSGIDGVGRIATSPLDDPERYASPSEYERFAEAVKGSAITAAEGRSTIAWQHDGASETAWVLFVSADYFSLVRPRLRLGELRVERRGADNPVVIIGERFWRDKLRSPSLAGLILRLNNVDVSVVGVMAESFTGPAGVYSPDIWLPLEDLDTFGTAPMLERRETRWLFVMAKPNSGVNAATMQGHLNTAVAAMAREWPDTHKGNPAHYFAVGQADGERAAVATAAAIGMGIIGLVLLLACFNVANLLLARAVERERDMGIRTALGAKPSRLMGLVVTEGLLIATLSGGMALLLAWWTQSFLSTFAMPIEQPQHIDLTPDRNVVLFITLLVAIAGVLPGLWPAVSAARVNVLQVLGSQGASTAGSRPAPLRRWLVGAQIAGSTMFLAVAALFVQSYSNALAFDPGFDRGHLLLAAVQPSQQGFDRDRARRYVAAVADRVRGLPGVVDVAVAQRAPFFIGYDTTIPVWPDNRSCEGGTCPKYPAYPVGPGYFETMGIGLAEGREFSAGATVGEIIVNGEFARAQWADGRALGRVVRIGVTGSPVTVVGVTVNTRTRGLDRERPAFFAPLAPEHYDDAVTIIARTSGDPLHTVRPMAEAAAAVDRDVPVVALKTMDQQMAVQMWPFRTLSWMFGICGALALVLATVGLAGVVIHSVSRRVREFGVRMSVGATPRDLMREVLGESLRMLVPGLVVGIALAAAGARLVQVFFVGVNVLNPAGYVAVAAMQTAIVAIACVYPALRASRVDPLIALRSE
jgi:predicted permease